MIDLHSHILPGIDDGARSLEVSLEMARIAVADGITDLACTPHITPGVFANEAAEIEAAVRQLQSEFDDAGIALQLFSGADIHVVPDLAAGLAEGWLPCLEGTHYFLFEPPHHVVPPGLMRVAREALSAGYTPILTHPERLTWIEHSYELICELDEAGVAVQLTAGSITGDFGHRARDWALRMLDEGRVDIIASDAHDPRRRPPILSNARDLVAKRFGEDAALQMVEFNPRLILEDRPLPRKRRVAAPKSRQRKSSRIRRLLGFE